MAILVDLRSWFVQAVHWPFTVEVGVLAAIGLVSLTVAHLVRE